MWQAMLLSVNIAPSEKILVNGFINVDGQKMSKSLGNVINPYDLVKEYGVDATRLFFLKELSQWEDSDMTLARFKSAYNSNLANGLGNLVSRLNKMSLAYFNGVLTEGDFVSFPIKMSVDYGVSTTKSEGQSLAVYIHHICEKYNKAIDEYDLTLASGCVWELIGTLDKYIQDYEPFKMVKVDEEGTRKFLWNASFGLMHIADLLLPLMPETAQKILKTLGVDDTQKISEKPVFAIKEIGGGLFMRKE
jgi:methionyl-tRNA synthetase